MTKTAKQNAAVLKSPLLLIIIIKEFTAKQLSRLCRASGKCFIKRVVLCTESGYVPGYLSIQVHVPGYSLVLCDEDIQNSETRAKGTSATLHFPAGPPRYPGTPGGGTYQVCTYLDTIVTIPVRMWFAIEGSKFTVLWV